MKKSLAIILFMLISPWLWGQEQQLRIVQFSGSIVAEDNNEQIPFVSIRIKNTYRGAIANEQGFFSVAVPEKDTIVFTAIGFKKQEVVIPTGLENLSYTRTIRLARDTVMMEEVRVYPWPSRDKFRQAFLNADVPEDDHDRAVQNLESLYMLSQNMAPDGSEGYKMSMDKMNYRISHYNIPEFVPVGNTKVPSTLMNPLAWAQFIKALKNGDFKKKQ